MNAPIETMTTSGAKRLSGLIKEFWSEKGRRVSVSVIDEPGVGLVIRSDMVNGQPRR